MWKSIAPSGTCRPLTELTSTELTNLTELALIQDRQVMVRKGNTTFLGTYFWHLGFMIEKASKKIQNLLRINHTCVFFTLFWTKFVMQGGKSSSPQQKFMFCKAKKSHQKSISDFFSGSHDFYTLKIMHPFWSGSKTLPKSGLFGLRHRRW